jgi:ParB-like chromosome segregation protein Spo0J
MSTTNGLTIQYVSPKKLRAAARNARVHPPRQLEELKATIGRFGFVNPVLADEKGILIAGHGRLAAAQALGLKSIPVIRLRGLTAKEKTALAIADNRIADHADWDAEMLRAELASLDDMDLKSAEDLETIGFTPAELERVLKPGGSETKQVTYHEQFAVIIECANEMAQAKLLKRFSSEGLKCKALIA